MSDMIAPDNSEAQMSFAVADSAAAETLALTDEFIINEKIVGEDIHEEKLEENDNNSSKLKVENDLPDEFCDVIDFSTSARWSERLKSPMTVAFSPSLNPNRPESLHGLGKCQVCVELGTFVFFGFEVWLNPFHFI